MRGIRLLGLVALLAASGCIFMPEGHVAVNVWVLHGQQESPLWRINAPIAGVTVWLDSDSRGRVALRGTTNRAGLVSFTVPRQRYTASIADFPAHLVFEATQKEVYVGDKDDVEFHTYFETLSEATLYVTVEADEDKLDDVLVELVHPGVGWVRHSRTDRDGLIVWSGIRRGWYEVRISDLPDWVQFPAVMQEVDLLSKSFEHPTFAGTIVGEWSLDVQVAADGAGLEGVTVQAVESGGVFLSEITDTAGVARLQDPAHRFFDVQISGFDDTLYRFPVTSRFVSLPLPPDLYTLDFSGTALNRAPAVTITEPEDGDSFPEGTKVQLRGVAIDREDGTLAGSSLVWTSDRDELLGTSQSVDRSDLSVGDHAITFTATDSDGDVGQASVQITIVANQPPTVTIMAPIQGARLTQEDANAFRGSGADAEDGALTGPALTWTSDRDGPMGSGEFFITDDLTAGWHVVTLTGMDSGGLTATASVTIQVVPNSPPTVTIVSPTAGASFSVGESVTFLGSATDLQDGAIPDGSLTWTSDRDSVLGAGGFFVRSDLSTGTHVITLTATDSHGSSASASVTIAVDNTPPTVSITEPFNGSTFPLGQQVTFIGTAVDAEDGPLSGTSMVWTSSWEGAIGTGTTFTRSDLRVGSHLITMTATDSRGASSTASITLTIQVAGTATIRGRVEVPGMGIPGVTVSATGPDSLSTITDANGDYTLSSLTAGTYTLAISNIPAGFVFTTTSRVVTLAVGQTVTVTFTGVGG